MTSPFMSIDSFLYPGHSRYRMHAVPEVTGAALIIRLEQAAIKRDIFISCNLKVTRTGHIRRWAYLWCTGSAVRRLNREYWCIICHFSMQRLWRSPELVSQHIPEMKEALYFGHPGNQGEAIIWGEALGAKLLPCLAIRGMAQSRIHMVFWLRGRY